MDDITEPKRSTKDRILDAAEILFAEHGYHGASIRDITTLAGVRLNLATYHFGSKDELFRQVVTREAKVFSEAMSEALDAALAAAGEHPPAIESIIEAFGCAAFYRSLPDAPVTRHYRRLIAQAAILNQRPDLLAPLYDIYDPYHLRYVEAILRALPGCSRENAFWLLHLMHSAVKGLCYDGYHIDHLANGLIRANDYETLLKRFVVSFSAAARQFQQL